MIRNSRSMSSLRIASFQLLSEKKSAPKPAYLRIQETRASYPGFELEVSQLCSRYHHSFTKSL